MSGAQIGDLGLLDIGDGRRIPVKVTSLDREGFVTRAERPLPGKGKAVFSGPALTLLRASATSLPEGVDKVLSLLPASFATLDDARRAIEEHHVPVCASCGASMPGEAHERVLCAACRSTPRPRPAYR